MYKFRMELAGTVIEADTLYESSLRYCRDYLTDKPAELSVSVTEEDIEKERGFATAEDPSVQDLEHMALYRKICSQLADRDTVLMHGSCVEVDSQAYLFCAPSGTGKSTHTRLWRQYFGSRAVMINDDKPLLRVLSGHVRIYGTPWNGKHRLGNNTSSPLKAICFLNRGEINTIKKVDPDAGLPLILKYTYRPEDPEDTLKVLGTASRIAGMCDFWSLECNMEEEAAAVSYTAMSE